MTLTKIWSRAEFCDGNNHAKWAGEAARQLEQHPADQEPPRAGRHFELLLEKYGIKQGVVVDFGCGTGLLRNTFEGMGYIGIDQNPAMLGGIHARFGDDAPDFVTFESPLGEVTERYPDLKEVADLGIFCTVLQHNHWLDASEILHQASLVLKPGAFLFMVEATFTDKNYPADCREKYRLPEPDPDRLQCVDGAAIFTPKGWATLLNQHGFDHLEFDGGSGHVARRRAE